MFRDWLKTNPDPQEAARALQRQLRSLDDHDRERWLDRIFEHLLARRRAYGICLFLLEGIADPAFLQNISNHMAPLPPLQSDDEEAHLADLIRILAAAEGRKPLPPVETYLLKRDLAPAWSTVPWALWPRRRRLFARAWTRFFRYYEPDQWTNTLVVRSFLTEPQAIRVVRQELEPDNAECWELLRAAVLRQSGLASWLTARQRSALERAIR